MRKFFIKLLLFFALNVLIAFIILCLTRHQYNFKNSNTESLISIMPHNTHYDAVFLGSSHGRVLSSSDNHERVENILEKKIINFSKTAAGPLPEKTYLSYFFVKGNSTKKIVYFIDPFVFYSSRWNENSLFLEDEPLRLDFFLVALKNGIGKKNLLNYVRSKYSIFWLSGSIPPTNNDQEDRFLDAVNSEAVKKRLAVLYPEGTSKKSFIEYISMLVDTIELAKKKQAELIFILPPTLLGKLSGMDELKMQLAVLRQGYGFEIYDFSDTIKEPKLYSDHDHLNTKGVMFFTQEYLKKILK